MSAGAIRAGRAFVELLADDTKFARGIKAAEAKLRAWGSAISGLGTKLMGAGTAMLTPLLASSKIFADMAGSLADMSTRTGLGVEALQGLGYAAQQTGATAADLENGIRRMQRAILDAGQGAETAVDALKLVGLSVSQLAGLSPEEQFKAIADGLSQISDPTTRAAAAMELLGRSGTKLLPMMMGGAQGLAEFTRKARDLGIVLSAEDVAAGDAFGDTLDTLWQVVQVGIAKVGAGLVPVLTDFANRAMRVSKVISDFAQANQETIVTVLKLGTAFVAAGAALKVVAVASGVAAAAMGVLTAAATVSGFQAIVAAGATAVAVFNALSASTSRLAAAFEEARSAGDQKRASDQAMLDRLQALSQQQSLTGGQMTEAQGIIAALTKTYGDLGLSIDATTGKISGLSEAQKRANDLMRQAAIEQVKAEMRATAADITKRKEDFTNPSIARSINEAFGDGEGGFVEDMFGYESGADIQADITKKQDQLNALSKRLEALMAGDTAALTGGAAPDVAAPGILPAADEGLDKAKERAEFEKAAQEDLARARIAAIEEETARERARINHEYDAKLKKAKDLGAETTALEKARQTELDTLNRAAAERWGMEQAERVAAEDKKRADAEKALAEDIERARIDLMEDGEAKRLAYLDMERRKALEQAATAGLDLAQVDELYRLKAANVDTTGQAKAQISSSASGTFSGFAAGRVGTGGINRLIELQDASLQVQREIRDRTQPAVFE